MNHEKPHLLVCGCSARIPVAKGQAGGQVRCQACGAVVDVPRLRDFAGLEVATDDPRPLRRWDAARGVLLAGAALAALAAVAATTIVSLASRAVGAAPDPEAIRVAVAAADTVEVHRAWQRLTEWGVDRLPTDDERRQRAVAASAAGVAMALWIVAGVGALIAAGAAWVVFQGGGSAGDRPSVVATTRGEAAPRGEGRG